MLLNLTNEKEEALTYEIQHMRNVLISWNLNPGDAEMHVANYREYIHRRFQMTPEDYVTCIFDLYELHGPPQPTFDNDGV